jgi:nucleotide-binding universal stress UspA family protein
MTSSPSFPPQPLPPVYKVVVGIDYHEASEKGLALAFDIALSRESQIYALTVAEGHAPGRPMKESEEMEKTFQDEAQQNLEKYLAQQLSELEKKGARLNRKRVGAAVDFGTPAASILALAQSIQADLVIVGTHGRTGIERLVLGSVAKEVLRGASCPVLVSHG